MPGSSRLPSSPRSPDAHRRMRSSGVAARTNSPPPPGSEKATRCRQSTHWPRTLSSRRRSARAASASCGPASQAVATVQPKHAPSGFADTSGSCSTARASWQRVMSVLSHTHSSVLTALPTLSGTCAA
eukprot:2501750-Prymnesium_polylepis.1